MNVREKKKAAFSVLIALLPFLSYYTSPIPRLDMGTFLLLIFFVFAVPKSLYKSDLLVLLVYVFYITPFSCFLLSDQNTSSFTVMMRYIKFIFILGSVFGFGFYVKYYDEKTTFKTMKCLIYSCAVFIIIQRVFFSFGITINNPLLRFATDDAYIDGYSMGNSFLFRPSAFFLEPSHLSIYGLVYLVFTLFKKDNFIDSLVVLITLLCSGSGIGLVFSVMIYSLYFMVRFRRHVIRIFISVFISIIGVLAMSRITFFQNVVSRLTTDNVRGGGNAILGRIGIEGYQLFFDKNLIQQIFGSGYGNVPANIYLNGFTYIINTLGIVGCCIFLWLIFKYMYRGEAWQKVGLLIVLGLTIGSQVFAPASLAFYFCVYNRQPILDNCK